MVSVKCGSSSGSRLEFSVLSVSSDSESVESVSEEEGNSFESLASRSLLLKLFNCLIPISLRLFKREVFPVSE